MGRAKAQALDHQEDVSAAADYLVDLDHLKRCPYHDEIYGGANFDLDDDFWKRVMSDRNRGDKGPIPWAASMRTRDFTDSIKEAYEHHSADSCYCCDKNSRD